MGLRLLVLAAAVALAACGDAATTTSDTRAADLVDDASDVAADTASADTAPAEDTAPACPSGTHPTVGGCDTTLTWESVGPLALGRDHHGTVIVETGADDAWLVVVGGWIGDGITGAVTVAPIAEDGSLGAMKDADADVPGGVAGQGIAVLGDRVVITGGKGSASGFPNLAATRVARVDSRGALSAWEAAGDLPAAVFHGNLAGAGERVWATGGGSPQGTEGFVVTAALDGDGHLGPWEEATPLPTPLSHHATFVHDGALYVVGGLTGDPAGAHTLHDAVWRAVIGDAGQLGDWTQVGTLPKPVGTHSAVVFNGEVWVLGGVVGPVEAFTGGAFRGPVDDDGALPTWESLPDALPSARAHVHQTPVRGARIYSVGGRASETKTALKLLWVGTFE